MIGVVTGRPLICFVKICQFAPKLTKNVTFGVCGDTVVTIMGRQDWRKWLFFAVQEGICTPLVT